jgi:hypothetical protein
MATVGKVDSVIEFAAHLQQSLLDHDKPIQDISMYLTSLPFQHKDLPSFNRVELNKQGVALWNICANVRQTGQLLAQKEPISKGSTPRPKREPYWPFLARTFAYLLLESASEADIHLLKNALRVAKECLGLWDKKRPGSFSRLWLLADARVLELTLKIVERAAILVEVLAVSSTYVAEYLLLRLALVCSCALQPMELRVTIARRGDKNDLIWP